MQSLQVGNTNSHTYANLLLLLRETRKKNKYRLPALKWQTLKYRKLTQMLREIKYRSAALQQIQNTQLTKMQRERIDLRIITWKEIQLESCCYFEMANATVCQPYSIAEGKK